MQGLIGRKIGMTRMFEKGTGRAVPVTVIQAANNIVHQVKTPEKDGYHAVQLGFGQVDGKKVGKPMAGHCKKLGTNPSRVIREFQTDSQDEKVQPGASIGVELFENVKAVDVVGISKGRGHAGTIKRYNFKSGCESHGNTNVREHGSTGSNTFPARVFRGLRMSGHTGNARVTVKNLLVVGIDKEAGLVFIKGAVPGPARGIVMMRKKTGEAVKKGGRS